MTHPEIRTEQAYVDRAYARLDDMRVRAGALASGMVRFGSGITHSLRVERDVLVDTSLRRAAALDIGDEQLVFGRLDLHGGETRYIGRVAVADGDYTSLVMDWRAPAAEPFYRATAREPLGVVRRRHLVGRGRRIVRIDDEVLSESPGGDFVLVGEGALLDAMRRARTGRMRDIVATIQHEQDEVIRAPLVGILVVQGGPGTGKTAVALHRAAYLLYTHRAQLERSGVLLVGPNPIFLRYIEQVLPALGEQAVTLATTSSLVPGLRVTAADDPDVERVKGDARMADVLVRAVEGFERGLAESVKVFYDGEGLELTSEATERIVARVRKVEGTHNSRRRLVVRRVLAHLWELYTAGWKESVRLGLRGPPEDLERVDFIEAVLAEPVLREALDRMWPVMGAERFLRELLSSRGRLEAVLDAHEAALLHRSSGGLTPADAALIDEAAVLLGPRARPRKKGRPKVDEEERWMIERLLDDLQAANPIIRAERDAFADHLLEARLALEESEPDGYDRTTFGHVLVDEAQDLSPMQWRMIARRSTAGSITLLGDLGQASGTWTPSNWSEVTAGLARFRKPKIAELTINYRTPAEVMVLAGRVLAASAPTLRAPRSVRATGQAPVFRRTTRAELLGAVAGAAGAEARRFADGKVAVVTAPSLLAAVRRTLGSPDDPDDLLDAAVAVLGADEVKSLEFDAVIVVEPGSIVRERSLRALYVALTRPTQRLVVVHAEPLPPELTARPARARSSPGTGR